MLLDMKVVIYHCKLSSEVQLNRFQPSFALYICIVVIHKITPEPHPDILQTTSVPLRSHIGWRGKRCIPIKGVETPP